MADAGYTGTATKVTSNAKVVAAIVKVQVKRIIVTNVDSAVRYLQTFDALTANVTVGTTAPTMVYAIPATDSRVIELDKVYETGLVYAVTTTSTTNTGATEAWVEVLT